MKSSLRELRVVLAVNSFKAGLGREGGGEWEGGQGRREGGKEGEVVARVRAWDWGESEGRELRSWQSAASRQESCGRSKVVVGVRVGVGVRVVVGASGQAMETVMVQVREGDG